MALLDKLKAIDPSGKGAPSSAPTTSISPTSLAGKIGAIQIPEDNITPRQQAESEIATDATQPSVSTYFKRAAEFAIAPELYGLRHSQEIRQSADKIGDAFSSISGKAVKLVDETQQKLTSPLGKVLFPDTPSQKWWENYPSAFVEEAVSGISHIIGIPNVIDEIKKITPEELDAFDSIDKSEWLKPIAILDAIGGTMQKAAAPYTQWLLSVPVGLIKGIATAAVKVPLTDLTYVEMLARQGDAKTIPQKVSIPLLGEITTSQESTKRRVMAGENAFTATLKEGTATLFDHLFIYSAVKAIQTSITRVREIKFGEQRVMDVTSKKKIPGTGLEIESIEKGTALKTGNEAIKNYVGFDYVDPTTPAGAKIYDALDAIKAQSLSGAKVKTPPAKVFLGADGKTVGVLQVSPEIASGIKKYDPSNAVFAKTTVADGQIVVEYVQYAPSYLSSFINGIKKLVGGKGKIAIDTKYETILGKASTSLNDAMKATAGEVVKHGAPGDQVLDKSTYGLKTSPLIPVQRPIETAPIVVPPPIAVQPINIPPVTVAPGGAAPPITQEQRPATEPPIQPTVSPIPSGGVSEDIAPIIESAEVGTSPTTAQPGQVFVTTPDGGAPRVVVVTSPGDNGLVTGVTIGTVTSTGIDFGEANLVPQQFEPKSLALPSFTQEQLAQFIKQIPLPEAQITPEQLSDAMARLEQLALGRGVIRSVEERRRPIVSPLQGIPAPTGVIPGERKLVVHEPTIRRDFADLLAGRGIGVGIAPGKEREIRRREGESDKEIIDRYLKVLLKFEEDHIRKGTVEQATKIAKGGKEGKKAAVEMDKERLAELEKPQPKEVKPSGESDKRVEKIKRDIETDYLPEGVGALRWKLSSILKLDMPSAFYDGKEALEMKVQDVNQRWGDVQEAIDENVRKPVQDVLARLGKEIATLPKGKEGAADRKRLTAERDNALEMISTVENMVEEESIQFQTELGKEAMAMGEKEGVVLDRDGNHEIDGEYFDNVVGRIFERPYIESNWKEKVKDVFAEAIDELKNEQVGIKPPKQEPKKLEQILPKDVIESKPVQKQLGINKPIVKKLQGWQKQAEANNADPEIIKRIQDGIDELSGLHGMNRMGERTIKDVARDLEFARTLFGKEVPAIELTAAKVSGFEPTDFEAEPPDAVEGQYFIDGDGNVIVADDVAGDKSYRARLLGSPRDFLGRNDIRVPSAEEMAQIFPDRKETTRLRLQSESKIQGTDLTASQVVTSLRGIVEERLRELGFSQKEVEIVDMELVGSRTTNTARFNSDLDLVVEIKGTAREDDVFNALNAEEPIEIDGLKVDVNPIKADKSGTLNEFLASGIGKRTAPTEPKHIITRKKATRLAHEAGHEPPQTAFDIKEVPTTSSGARLLKPPISPLLNGFIGWFKNINDDSFAGARLSIYKDGEPYFITAKGEITLRDYLGEKEYNEIAVRPIDITNDTQNEVLQELAVAEPGKRIFIDTSEDRGPGYTKVMGIPSSIPSWIPEPYRKTALIREVVKHINEGTVPTKKAEAALFELTREEMARREQHLADIAEAQNTTPDQLTLENLSKQNDEYLAKLDEAWSTEAKQANSSLEKYDQQDTTGEPTGGSPAPAQERAPSAAEQGAFKIEPQPPVDISKAVTTAEVAPLAEVGRKTLANANVRIEYSRDIKESELPQLQEQFAPARVSTSGRFLTVDTSPEAIKAPVEAAKPEKAPRATGGFASRGGENLGNFETIEGNATTPAHFKLFEKAQELLKKYGERFGEGTSALQGNLGIYYPTSQNIFINAINNLSTLAHEITHHLDHTNNIVNNLVDVTTKGEEVRRRLTDIYAEYYPGGRREHPLMKRMREGLATLLQHYVEMPSTIEAKYPDLVADFLKEGGRYYKPVMGEIIKDLRQIIAEYQGLNPLDKIGARIVSDELATGKKSFMSLADRIREEVADNLFPISKLAQKAGVAMTKADPSLWARQYNNVNSLITNNLAGDKGMWMPVNGEMRQVLEYNWKDLVRKLTSNQATDDFRAFLVARRQYFSYRKVDEMLAEEAEKMREIEDLGGFEEAMKLTDEDGNNPVLERKQMIAEREALEGILERDGMTRGEVTEAYEQNSVRFESEAGMFDALVREDLRLLSDREVQLIKPEEFVRLSKEEGYATFKRQMYNEITGEEETPITPTRVGGTKASSMMRRKGSSRSIIDPVTASMRNHAEILRKSYKQIVYNKMAGIAGQLPELFQKTALSAVPQEDGKIIFPQEKEPSIIMARENYKRVPILTDNYVKRVIDEVLTPVNYGYFEKLVMGASRLFVRGTTTLFPAFAPTNIVIDQITALANTRNNYIPIYDSLKDLARAVLVKDSPEAKYLQEYLMVGGENQTFVGWSEMTPNELAARLSGEKTALQNIAAAIDKGLDWASLPSKTSEIFTRAAEYIKARQAGKHQVVALEEAGSVTAPFHHIGRLGGGRFGRTTVRSLAYFNSSIQVLDQTARKAFGTDGKKGQARFWFTTAALTASVIGAMWAFLNRATDDQKRQMRDLSAQELSAYIWWPNRDGKTLNRSRIPAQMAVLGTMVNLLMIDHALDAKYKIGDYVEGATAFLPAQLNPTDPGRMLANWSAQVLAPGIKVYFGVRDFPNVIPLETPAMKALPSEERYNKKTSAAAIFMGRTELAKQLDLSPVKIDALMTGYLGRAMGFVTGKPDITDLASGFHREVDIVAGRTIGRYYDLRDEVNQELKADKDGLKDLSSHEKSVLKKMDENATKADKLLKEYRKVDQEQHPQKAAGLRQDIIKVIDRMMELDEKR